MNNLLGQDFMNITRIYDLKGSTYGRKVQLSDEEEMGRTGLKVLKDLNFIELGEKLNVYEAQKEKLLNIIEQDSVFLE